MRLHLAFTPRSLARPPTWATSLIFILLSATSFASGLPSLLDADLGRGAYARMHMLLEKTILAVDVATIEVRVDPQTERKFELLNKGKSYSPELEEELAQAMFGAQSAVVQVKFLRAISLDQFVDGVRESLDEAHQAGVLSDALRKRVSAGLPQWFETMKDSGFRAGDRVVYKINPSQLRTVVIRNSGELAVDRSDEGAENRMILLGSYFASTTSYRQPLLRSLGK